MVLIKPKGGSLICEIYFSAEDKKGKRTAYKYDYMFYLVKDSEGT
jgi:hypothetical protein